MYCPTHSSQNATGLEYSTEHFINSDEALPNASRTSVQFGLKVFSLDKLNSPKTLKIIN